MTRARAVRLALLGLLALAVVWLVWFRSTGPAVEPGTTVVVELAGEYVEAPEPPLAARLLGDRSRPFVGLLSVLELARRDERVDTVVLRIRGLQIGWGKAQEIRRALERLREAEVRTLAYLELASFGASRDYYVASAADEVVVAPAALTPVVGLAAEYLFLGGLWEKLGIEIESERIGRYKSAVETYAGEKMSEPAREMANSLLDSFERQFLEGIASSRGMSVDAVRRAVDAGPVVGSELVSLGLVDAVGHLEGRPEMEEPVLEAGVYAGIDPAEVGFEPVARFALVYGAGPVVLGDDPGPARGPVFASDPVARALETAAEDPEVDAIVLRIDSPGGSALASELIWKAVRQARASGKPVIASLSDVAASGGYYAAVGADHIVADPGVLTGSIGVFVLRPVLDGLLERIGVNAEGLTRGEHADFLLSTQPLSEGARERLRTLVVSTYDLFVERVAKGRELPNERVDALGQGRVWTGAQAVERGLVDELGGLHEAVAAGRRNLELAEDADVALVPYPAPTTLAQELAEALQGRVLAEAALSAWPGAERLREPVEWLRRWPARTPLAVPPFWLDVR